MKLSLGSADAARPGGPEAGTILDGRYRLDEELARGGMGRVFAGLDTELGRKVAIKLIASPSPTATALARFHAEARALAKVTHPNILTVYDAGPKGSPGEPYLVCELLEGLTLREKAAHCPPLSVVLEIAAQMAAALAAVHEQGIVHRDLKPENVFMTREGWVKLIDFGIAKVLLAAVETLSEDASSDAQPAPATAEGRIIGTVGYMAP
jgi:serine/threonine protein kinase